jgi:hypothetical protein
MASRIGLAGDATIGRNVDRRGHSRPPTRCGGPHDRLAALDGVFVTLECVLSTRGRRSTRTYRPFHFRAGPAWATTALLDTLDALDGVVSRADVRALGAVRDRRRLRPDGGPLVLSPRPIGLVEVDEVG